MSLRFVDTEFPTLKECAQCMELLPFSRFAKRQHTEDGFSRSCMSCNKDRKTKNRSKSYRNNPPLPRKKFLSRRPV